jgi:hypothetical protein
MNESDPTLAPLLAYLREHSPRYGLAALRGELLRHGYDPAVVDRALQAYQEETRQPAAVTAPRQRVWPRTLVVLAINVLLAAAAAGVLALPGVGDSATNVVWIGIVLAGCLEFFGAIGLAISRKTQTWGLAILFGVLLSIALGFLALTGVCIYMLAHGQGH